MRCATTCKRRCSNLPKEGCVQAGLSSPLFISQKPAKKLLDIAYGRANCGDILATAKFSIMRKEGQTIPRTNSQRRRSWQGVTRLRRSIRGSEELRRRGVFDPAPVDPPAAARHFHPNKGLLGSSAGVMIQGCRPSIKTARVRRIAESQKAAIEVMAELVAKRA